MEKTIEEIKAKIINEAEYVDIKPYSHNIISLYLGEVNRRFGKEMANQLIKDCGLETLGWHKVD